MGFFMRYYGSAFFASFVFSVVFFIFAFHLIGILDHTHDKKHDETGSPSAISQLSKFIECEEKRDWNHIDVNVDCYTGASGLQADQDKSEYSFIRVAKSQIGKESLFDLIYGLLFLCLLIQSAIFFYVLFSNKKIPEKYFYLSDWAINSSPLLGVLGTIASFAALVSNSNGVDMQEIFKQNFSVAAITTITGGFIYITNLLFSFKISQYFDGQYE